MAEITGFGQSTIRAWCCRPETPAYKWGRAWRCDEEKFRGWIDRLQEKPKRPDEVWVYPRKDQKMVSLDPEAWDLAGYHKKRAAQSGQNQNAL